MNGVDLLLIVIIALGAWGGYRRGFVRGAIDLLTLALSLLFALRVYPWPARFVEKTFPSVGVWATPLGFLLAFLLARFVLGIITERVLRRSRPAHRQDAVPSRPDKLLGILPGTVNGLINAAIVSALLLATPLFDGLSQKTRESPIAARLIPPIEWAEDKLAPVFNEAVNHSINRMTLRDTASHGTVALPYSVKDPKPREDLEARMLELVNRERQKAGLGLLVADPEMLVVARAHSADMFARSYFSHDSPEGKTLADRTKAAGVRYGIAGENLALAQTLTMAHEGLMNSPGHKANILHKSYKRVGIGILDGGRYGIMVTQNFRN